MSLTLHKLIFGQLRNLLVIALVLSLGIGSTVIQVVAWATMIPTQLVETGSITEAVENTFSGKHACPMCELAATKRDAEESPTPLNSESKKEKPSYILCRISPIQSYPPRASSFPFPQSSLSASKQSDSPDTPPPQLLS